MSGRFDSGVKGYVVGEYTVKVYFPVDMKGEPDIACKHCPYYRANSYRCGLNETMVAYGEKFVGAHCPLRPEKDNEGKEEE